jgi:hypothetical protein
LNVVLDDFGHAVKEYMVAQPGGWGLDTMMSNGAGEATASGEDAAAIDAYNAYAIAYNQNVDVYNAQVAAYNASVNGGSKSWDESRNSSR